MGIESKNNKLNESFMDGLSVSSHFKTQYILIVEYCVELRTKNDTTIQNLAKDLGIDRRKLSDFEKLKIFDMIIASNVMEYFNDEITFLRKKRYYRKF